MRTYFAYIRVSTVKQGEKGSSLTEQRDAILAYAQKHGLIVSEFFEEQQTAAKVGRAAFRKMLIRLKRGHAHGLIMHKIDRGARNLADWAEIAALKDIGIDVHFAHEAIDLNSRGGRLSADIQAVVAADFIRNLREEVKKGIYGRLKQGYYPFKAPPGYRDNGKGELKTIDPIQGPLMREAFENYAGGLYGMADLTAHTAARGLRNSTGRPFNKSGLAGALRNTFYYGLLVVRGQSFVGKHESLISKSLFDECRARAAGRLVSPTRSWGSTEYNFRGLAFCSDCGRRLYPETQKGNIYYRCHSQSCKGTCLSEKLIETEIAIPLSYLPTPPALIASLENMFRIHTGQQSEKAAAMAKTLNLRLSQIDARITTLTDVFIDGAIDRASYDTRRTSLQNERIDVEQSMTEIADPQTSDVRARKFLELAKCLQNLAHSPNAHIFREFAKSSLSNFCVRRKTVDLRWSGAILTLLDVGGVQVGARERGTSRTCTLSDTERDEAFKRAVKLRGRELYEAVINDANLDQITLAVSDNEVPRQYPNLRHQKDRS